ncbi:MAG: hypothetical protein ACE5K0_00215, partial [Candidatus Methanofastidiosia archaeon]
IAVDGGVHVVWEGYDGSDDEIYYWDGTTVSKISTHADNVNNSDYNPQIAVDGGVHVVWEGYDGSDWEIYYTSERPERRRVNINNTIKPLASNRLSRASDLLEKTQSICSGLKEKEDPKFDECCSGTLDEAISLLEMAEKFYMSGNFIAANNYAMKAIQILNEILECCEG